MRDIAIDIDNTMAYRSKKKAQMILQGDEAQHYAWIRDYAIMIKA